MSDDLRARSPELQRQAAHERTVLAYAQAKNDNKSVVYIDDDGCEITVTPEGYVFYNVSDWY